MKINLFASLQPISPIVLAIALISTMSLIACDKNEEDTPQPEIEVSEEEAVAVVERAITANTQGVGAELEDAVYLADQYAETSELLSPCGEAFDSTLIYYIDQGNLSATYTIDWAWLLTCNALGIPLAIDYQRNTTGQYESLRMYSADSASSNWSVSNLIQGENYILEGSYIRQGTQQSKVGNQSSFSSTLEIGVNNLQIDKATKHIQNGMASFTLSITGPNSNTPLIEGDIIFNGDGTATITINGNTYTVNLY